MRDPLARQAVADLTRSQWTAQSIALLLGVSVRTIKRHGARTRARRAAIVRVYDELRQEMGR